MSIIKIPFRLEGSKDEAIIYTLVDSGATFSCISEEYAKKLASLEKMRRPPEVPAGATDTYLKIENRVTLDFYYNDIRLSDEFIGNTQYIGRCYSWCEYAPEMAHKIRL